MHAVVITRENKTLGTWRLSWANQRTEVSQAWLVMLLPTSRVVGGYSALGCFGISVLYAPCLWYCWALPCTISLLKIIVPASRSNCLLCGEFGFSFCSALFSFFLFLRSPFRGRCLLSGSVPMGWVQCDGIVRMSPIHFRARVTSPTCTKHHTGAQPGGLAPAAGVLEQLPNWLQGIEK